jgi:hypothetical protein
MNSPLPVEGQKVEVKLREGEWQAAVYREEGFVDLYGLPLDFDKVLQWRPAATAHINGSNLARSGAGASETRAG